jgi:hypothetical protein
VDPEPDLGGATVELGPRRRSLERPIEGATATAAAGRRRGWGRRDVAAGALDRGAELVGPVAERRLRGPRWAHGCRRRQWIWISASVVGRVREMWEGARRRWEIELDGRIERKWGQIVSFFGHVGENSNALACNCCN